MRQRFDMNLKSHLDEVMAVCCGVPRGDELPQVASAEDIAADIFCDAMNVTREYALGHFHHQFDDGLDYDDLVH